MTHPKADETVQDLRQSVESAGFSASPAQLRRWQQAGVIPKPKKRGLGRGSGSEVSYPPGAALQAVAFREELSLNRSISAAGWRIWWRGYPVSEEVIRSEFESQLESAEVTRSAAEELENERTIDGKRDLGTILGEFGRRRLSDSLLAAARRRTGKSRFPRFLLILNRTFSGLHTDLAEGDAELLAKGFGFGKPKEIEQVLSAVAAAFNPKNLRDSYESASLLDLADARDEVQEMLSLLDVAKSLIYFVLPTRSPKSLLDVYGRPLNADLASLTLLWLNVRNLPEARESFDALVAAIDNITKTN